MGNSTVVRCVTLAGALICAALLSAQTHPLHVSPNGIILDDANKPVLLYGLNRSGTGSGNADATATTQDYAAQNRLLPMNVVRLFINAAWWTGNVQVLIANMNYQSYIDQLIQRVKSNGDYVLILKAGQFPDPPCGSDGKNCPAANQGDLNCQANASLCAAQDTTGNTIDTAFAFWSGFANKYAGDPAVLYDTWEDMHSITSDTWADDQNQLIAVIRSYNPRALIFVEDTGTAFESIAAGALPDFDWSNIVWNFHLYNASTSTCTEPASPRYANWPTGIEALVSYAQQHGHAAAITEWGGCNDSEPYNTNIASYAQTHSLSLVYFDNTYLITQTGGNYQLTATGSKVAQAYAALAADSSSPAPALTTVLTAGAETAVIAPNTWVEIKGTNLAPSGDTRIWDGATDFFANRMPEQLDGVSVTVNGKAAFVYYISPTQVNILTPPDAIQGPVQVKLSNAGLTSSAASVTAQPVSPSFFMFGGGPYVAAVHANGTLLGPVSLYPNLTTPAKPGETVQLYANGFGATTSPIVGGSVSQSGSLSPLPVVQIGGLNATVSFAGLISPGEFQFNIVVPANAPNGDLAITASYGGSNTQAGALITIAR